MKFVEFRLIFKTRKISEQIAFEASNSIYLTILGFCHKKPTHIIEHTQSPMLT